MTSHVSLYQHVEENKYFLVQLLCSVFVGSIRVYHRFGTGLLFDFAYMSLSVAQLNTKSATEINKYGHP